MFYTEPLQKVAMRQITKLELLKDKTIAGIIDNYSYLFIHFTDGTWCIIDTSVSYDEEEGHPEISQLPYDYKDGDAFLKANFITWAEHLAESRARYEQDIKDAEERDWNHYLRLKERFAARDAKQN